MGVFLSAMLFAVVATAIPTSVSAVQVDIKYNITSGINNTAQLGGAAPTSGSATVRWQLTSLYGNFYTYAFATLRTLVLINAYGTLAIGAPLSLFQGTDLPVLSATGVPLAPGLPPPFSLARVKHYAPAFAPPTFFIIVSYLLYNPPQTISYRGLSASGAEVSRVPEPDTTLLLALGLCGLAAGRTLLRRRRRPTA